MAWGGFGTVMAASQQLNDRRDVVLGIKDIGATLSVEYKEMIIYGDFLTIWIGICAFLAAIAVVVWKVPKFIDFTDSDFAQHQKAITVTCKVVGGIAAFVRLSGRIGDSPNSIRCGP